MFIKLNNQAIKNHHKIKGLILMEKKKHASHKVYLVKPYKEINSQTINAVTT